MDDLRIFGIENDQDYDLYNSWVIIAKSKEDAARLLIKNWTYAEFIGIECGLNTNYEECVVYKFTHFMPSYSYYPIYDYGPVQEGIY